MGILTVNVSNGSISSVSVITRITGDGYIRLNDITVPMESMYRNFFSDVFTFSARPLMTGFKTTYAVMQHMMGIDSKYPEKIGIKE